MRYAILAAFRNRRVKTIRFLELIRSDVTLHSVEKAIILFDDGSTDGTAAEIAERFPEVTVLRGDGSFYWNGAMHALLTRASSDPSIDAYIMANDDIVPAAASFSTAISLYERMNHIRPTVVVGAFCDEAGRTTYSGFQRVEKHRPLSLKTVEPVGEPCECDTFNGNMVIIPASSYRSVGGIDPKFLHSFGDIDLGYRLAKYGVRLVVTPTHMGQCTRNRTLEEQLAPLSLTGRFKVVFGPLRSMGDYSHFVLKHSPMTAPIRLLNETLKRLLAIIRGR